jgi:hypothetical protein
MQTATKNTDKKKKGNMLQFLKIIDNTDLLGSTHNNEQQNQENICDDEFEKNNKEFFESVKQVKLKDKINKMEDYQKECIDNESNKINEKNQNITNQKIKKCHKCNIDKSIEFFSKHKTTADGYDNRCRDCVGIMRKKIKEKIKNELKEDDITKREYLQNTKEYLDIIEPDLTTTDWQGGKLKGTYFKRKNADKYTVCVEKKSVVVSTEEDAKKMIIRLNKEYTCAKNMYKIITNNNKKYVVMQLSNGYVGLFDFDKLDLLRKLNLAVTKTSEKSNPNSKYYCLATLDNRGCQIHNVITDYDMVDHRNRYPLDNRHQNLSLTNPRENNMNRSKISNKKIDLVDKQYKCIIKYVTIDPKTKAFCSRTDEKSFDNKEEGLTWLDEKSKDLDCDISIYDDEVMQLKKSYEEIMIKYADEFKWCDNDNTKNKYNNNSNNNSDDSDKSENKSANESDDKTNNNKLSKLDKYKQFKDIDPDFTMQKYDINLKSNTISHLTFEEIEYKFCSQCNKWNNITNYHAYNSSVDKLNKYCKSCSKQLKQNSENTNSSTKNWKDQNKEKIAEYNKKYREENREKLLESSRKSQEDKDKLIHDRRAKYYQDFKTKCEEHEGELLSQEIDYETAHSKLRVRCKQNHEFEITWNNCKKNKWCTQCRK